jgi:CrcB protein
MLRLFFLAGTGSALGGILRYAVQLFFQKGTRSGFPWDTFWINLAGSFVIGILFGLSRENKMLDENSRIFLMTGLCGGFTTFSAFSLDNIKLIQAGLGWQALLYASASILLGIAATFAGMACSRLYY